MFGSTDFWVLVPTVIFIVLVWKPAKARINAALDARADRIARELNEARALRDEAREILAEAERRQGEAFKDAEDIIAHAQEEAARLRRNAISDAEATIRRREAQANEKIQQAETAAIKHVRETAIDIAMTATGKIVAERMSDEKAATLVDQAITDLPRRLN